MAEPPPPAYAELTTRVLKYQLRQENHKTQTIFPITATASTSYFIKKKSSIFAMSSEPDLVITRKSSDMKREEMAGSLKTAKTGSFPWVPRTVVKYVGDAVSVASSDEMILKQFRDLHWGFNINDRPHCWKVVPHPTRFVLLDQETGILEASFIYSAFGSTAKGGAEVGQFEIACFGSESDPHYLEQVFFTAVAVISYARDAGRMLVNRSKRAYHESGGLDNPSAPAYCEEAITPGFEMRERAPAMLPAG